MSTRAINPATIFNVPAEGVQVGAADFNGQPGVNTARKTLIIQNTSTTNIFFALGTEKPEFSAGHRLPPDSMFILEKWQGPVLVWIFAMNEGETAAIVVSEF